MERSQEAAGVRTPKADEGDPEAEAGEGRIPSEPEVSHAPAMQGGHAVRLPLSLGEDLSLTHLHGRSRIRGRQLAVQPRSQT